MQNCMLLGSRRRRRFGQRDSPRRHISRRAFKTVRHIDPDPDHKPLRRRRARLDQNSADLPAADQHVIWPFE
ncbi:hypothetical protein AYO47_08380 [Planctomyces sp. SCGC AG-212-M04]|nr:hypothetical protein AYO47_08380 [Planctomyces sp. SCGC AG-212-M04]